MLGYVGFGFMSDRLDKYQARAVHTATNSVITAGAGAGKTSVIAARFIHLVVERTIRSIAF